MAFHAGATRTSGTSWHQRGKGQSGASLACCQGTPLKMSLFWPVLLQILGSLQSVGHGLASIFASIFLLCFVPCSQSLLRHPSRGRCATSELVTFCSPGSPSLGSQEPLNLLSLLCRESRVSPVQPCPSYKMRTLMWFICPAQLERRESLGPRASGCLGSR